MTVTLYHGDCLEVLRTLNAGSVDAVVTDPPYGMKSHNMRRAASMMSVDWDEAPISQKTIDGLLNMSPVTVIWGGNYYALPPFRCALVWDKKNDGRSFAECEIAWTNLDAVARVFRMRPQNMDGGKVHPTQKPVALMEWCLEIAKVPGGATVLDPFMGSGTTGVACVQTGRNFIGVEIDRGYYEIAERRIAEAQAQLRMEL